jgi:hypothetical protein
MGEWAGAAQAALFAANDVLTYDFYAFLPLF